MLTSKQRAKLKSIASTTDTILQIGKGGLGEQLITQVTDALKARELIKLHVLESAPESAKELAETLATATKSEVVQIIGKRIVLYKRNEQKPVITFSVNPEKEVKKDPKKNLKKIFRKSLKKGTKTGFEKGYKK